MERRARTSLRVRATGAALVALLPTWIGCAADDGDTIDDDVKRLTLCPKQEVRGGLARCAATYAEAPFVRPSLTDSFSAGGTGKFFGAMLPPRSFEGALRLFDRTGKVYFATDAQGTPLDFTRPPETLRNLKLPSNRVYFTLYRFEGKRGPSVQAGGETGPGFILTKATPVAEVDGCAVDSLLLGTWEGTVSKRLSPEPEGNPMFTKFFDEEDTAPIRVSFTRLEKFVELGDWTGEPIGSHQTYMAKGSITNYADLTALGKKSPFLGSSNGDVELYRKASMHGLGNDNHWVLTYPSGTTKVTGNGMAYEMQALSMASLIAPARLSPAMESTLREMVIRPHLPFNNDGHVVVLRPTRIGASAGKCPR